MQTIRFNYLGSNSRKVVVSGREQVIISGDNNSTQFIFTIPASYSGYGKGIVWGDFYIETDNGVITSPMYQLSPESESSQNNTYSFTIPQEITAPNSGKEIYFQLLFFDTQNGSNTRTIVESSLQFPVYVSKSVNRIQKPSNEDALSELSSKAFVDQQFQIDDEQNRPALTFTTIMGNEISLDMDVPYLTNGKVDPSFLSGLVRVFEIDSSQELVTLTDAVKGDFAYIDSGQEQADMYMLVGDDYSVLQDWQVVHKTETDAVTEGSTRPITSGAVYTALQDKTSITMAIGEWDQNLVYNSGSTVVSGYNIYISLIDNNIGNIPSSSSEYWTQVQGGGEIGGTTVVTASFTFGDGINNTYVIQHGLNTMDFVYQIRYTDQADQYMYTYANVKALTADTLQISLSSAPPADSLKIIIGALVGQNGNGIPTYRQTIGNGTAKTFTIQHNLGTKDFLYSFRVLTGADQGQYINNVTVDATSYNECTITFDQAPQANSISVLIVPANKTSAGTNVFYFTDQQTVWNVTHNLNRLVVVQAYDENDKVLEGVVTQIDSENLMIEFNQPHSGHVVLA